MAEQSFTAAELRELLRKTEADEAAAAELSPAAQFAAELRDGKLDPRRLADVIEALDARGLFDAPEEPAPDAEAPEEPAPAAPAVTSPTAPEEV